TRAVFIRNLVRTSGLTYVQATQAYESFIKTIDDGICSGSRIQLGKVGSITPVTLAPRPVEMGFRRKKGEVVKQSRTYWLGTRIKFKFVVFKSFMNSRTLNWKFD